MSVGGDINFGSIHRQTRSLLIESFEVTDGEDLGWRIGLDNVGAAIRDASVVTRSSSSWGSGLGFADGTELVCVTTLAPDITAYYDARQHFRDAGKADAFTPLRNDSPLRGQGLREAKAPGSDMLSGF